MKKLLIYLLILAISFISLALTQELEWEELVLLTIAFGNTASFLAIYIWSEVLDVKLDRARKTIKCNSEESSTRNDQLNSVRESRDGYQLLLTDEENAHKKTKSRLNTLIDHNNSMIRRGDHLRIKSSGLVRDVYAIKMVISNPLATFQLRKGGKWISSEDVEKVEQFVKSNGNTSHRIYGVRADKEYKVLKISKNDDNEIIYHITNESNEEIGIHEESVDVIYK